jgi:hypothetical protein
MRDDPARRGMGLPGCACAGKGRIRSQVHALVVFRRSGISSAVAAVSGGGVIGGAVDDCRRRQMGRDHSTSTLSPPNKFWRCVESREASAALRLPGSGFCARQGGPAISSAPWSVTPVASHAKRRAREQPVVRRVATLTKNRASARSPFRAASARRACRHATRSETARPRHGAARRCGR